MSQNKTLKTITAAMVLILFHSLSAQADACFDSRPDAIKDMQELERKIKVVLKEQAPTQIVKASLTSPTQNVLDHKYHKIDRTQAFYDQFNAVGVVTAKPINGKFVDYGTAILISPCHVLTNRHVATGNVGSDMYFSVGQAQCKKGDDKQFANQNLKARVLQKGLSDKLLENDWAILQVEDVSGVKAVELTDTSLLTDEKVLMTGYPFRELSKDGNYRDLRGVIAKNSGVLPNGTVQLSDNSDLPGSSGAGAFILEKDSSGKRVPLLWGIHRGEGRIIEINTIVEQIRVQNPTLYKSIQRAIQTGSCK